MNSQRGKLINGEKACPNYKAILKRLRRLPETDKKQIIMAKIWQAIEGFYSDGNKDFNDRLTAYIFEQIKKDLKCT